MSVNPTAPTSTVLQAIIDYPNAQIVHVAAKLGLADLLADGPRSVEDLASATDTHTPSLARLVRALIALGVLADAGDGQVNLTALGAPLRADVPGSVRNSVLMLGAEWTWRTWGGLLHSVRTGEPAFDRIYGMSNFEYWEHNNEAGVIHDAFFREMARTTSAPLVAAYDFSRYGAVVDVGGSNGALLAAILHAHSTARGRPL
jgi:hypothetical protein